MAKKKERSRQGLYFWLIMITMVCIMLIVFTVIQKEKYNGLISQIEEDKIEIPEYRTAIIKLDNNNHFTQLYDEKVVDFLCDEGVVFSNHEDNYYASTWEQSNDVLPKYKGMKAICIVKIKRTD